VANAIMSLFARLAASAAAVTVWGWFEFFTDTDVQQAINSAYDAQKISPYLEVLRTKAIIDAIGAVLSQGGAASAKQ
jgi:hypothetical protein